MSNVQIIATDRAGTEHDISTYIRNERWATTMPGGCESFSAVFQQPVDGRYPELDFLNKVEVWDPEWSLSDPLWSGRIWELQKSVGADEQIEIMAKGPFVDACTRHYFRRSWKQNNMAEFIATNADTGGKFATDTTNRIYFEAQEDGRYSEGSTASYRITVPGASGNPGGPDPHPTPWWTRVTFNYASQLSGYFAMSCRDPWRAMNWFTHSSGGAVSGTFDSGYLGDSSGAAYLDFLMTCDNGPATIAATGLFAEFSNITLYGTVSGATGITPGYVIADALQSLPAGEIDSDFSNVATGATGTHTVLDHFAIVDSTRVADIIEQVNAFCGRDFAIWGDWKPYYADRSSTGTAHWSTRLDMGAVYRPAQTMEEYYGGASGGVLVGFEDQTSGSYYYPHSEVWATGAAAELTDAGLSAETRIDAPVPYKTYRKRIGGRQHGRGRWETVRSGTQARQMGTAFLADHGGNLKPNGTLTIPMGALFTGSGSAANPRHVRAGQNIQILDLFAPEDAFDSFDGKTIARIAATEWDEQAQELTLTLDASLLTYEALVERMANKYREASPGHPWPRRSGNSRVIYRRGHWWHVGWYWTDGDYHWHRRRRGMRHRRGWHAHDRRPRGA